MERVKLASKAAALALALACAAIIAGGYRIYSIERGELEHVTEPRTLRALMQGKHATRLSARVTQLPLRANDRAVFELCARDGMPEARWRDALELAVIALDQNKLMLRVPMDAAHLAHVKRNASGGCLLLGSGLLETGGSYSIEAVWPKGSAPSALLDVPISARVLAKPELGTLDRSLVLALALAVLALLASAVGTLRDHDHVISTERDSTVSIPRRPMRMLAPLLAVLVLFAGTELPLFGSTRTFIKGMLLLAIQCGLAIMLGKRLAPADARTNLALIGPERRLPAFLAALCAWPLLVYGAQLAMRLVPSTGEAPIEAFVSWPSGMLSAAMLGVLLPLGEELFFRGYIYAALLPAGRWVAATTSLLAFVALHAEQSYGNWGALLAIANAGLVFTALRMFTGSTLVPAFTHVAYNLALSLTSIFRS